MNDLDRIIGFRKKVDQNRHQMILAEGAAKHAMEKLKDEFNCVSLTQAKRILRKKQNNIKTLRQKINIKLRKFKKKWEQQLDL